MSPMRPDIRPGGIFPDYALPDHTGTVRTLSELQGRDPLILTLARGNYCPKEHQQHLELAANYSKVAVAYTQIATIATDDHHTREILLRERSSPMGETRRKFDKDFREGAVRLVRETGKPIAQVARDLGINEGTLGNWVNADRRRRGEGDGALGEDERAELARLRKENAELAMRCDVLKRSVALWVSDAMGR